MIIICLFVCFVVVAECGPANESYRDQYCTDPRTMLKHAAYSEWADVYSCTKHRCQPGGRSLAIYTVGCKRVEAPESAIECEEVVEDTNMQFPYCCTRLRCLVVVRGEVWTRVLGQPWETLPAAPWSHMYKMKKPPPGEGEPINKAASLGPIYELAEPPASDQEKSLRSAPKANSEPSEYSDKDMQPRGVQTPDIVIALSTNSLNDKDEKSPEKRPRYSSKRKSSPKTYFEEITTDEPQESQEKATLAPAIDSGGEQQLFDQQSSDEKSSVILTATLPSIIDGQSSDVKQATITPWEFSSPTWPKNDAMDENNFNQRTKIHFRSENAEEKPGKSNLQALVDAIGTRMRDIQTVVEKMSEKVKESKETAKLSNGESESDLPTFQRRNNNEGEDFKSLRPKKISVGGEPKKRFTPRKGSRYLQHGPPGAPGLPSPAAETTDQAAPTEESNGYFSDASNMVLRRSAPKEPVLTYMAPVPIETRRTKTTEKSDEDKKHRRHNHKMKHLRSGRKHRKHHKDADRRKKFNKLSSSEADRNGVSNEDNSNAFVK